MLRLYNTLTRKKEEFQTLEPNLVKMYVCGVTVYNDAHVGHAMSALVFDIIRRYLEYRGYTVKHVMNYTDVDDKIINRAKQLNEDPLKLSQRYIEDYANDLQELEYPACHIQSAGQQDHAAHHQVHRRLDPKGTRLRRIQRRCVFQRHQRRGLRQTLRPQTG